jgi:FHS family L-fucose permease-like MFS transporter
MANLSQPTTTLQSSGTHTGTTGPLVIITILFFMWGLLTALNDVLIPHLKELYTLTYVQAMMVQFCFFGAYFIVSLPAGALIRRIGYQNGAVAGLVLAAAGCALFYPAADTGDGRLQLGLLVVGGGVTIKKGGANPLV